MPIHSNTDPEHVWPLTLSIKGREHLALLKTARTDATNAWRATHSGSKQKEIPHKDFLDLLGVKMDATILSRLLSDRGYPVGTAADYLNTLAAAITQWRMAQAFAQVMPDRPIHELPWYAGILAHAQGTAALVEQGEQERCVVFLAPTGGGKTTLARWLREQIGRCYIVSARESWRTSYFSVLSSILRALGQPPQRTAQAAEEAVLSYLTANKVTLIFDEQDFFGRAALNLIRLLLNETRTSVVMLMVPQTWDRMVLMGAEYSAQLCRRCVEVEKAPALTKKDALVFLREQLPEAEPANLKEAAAVLAAEANKFGGLSLLSGVAAMLGNTTLEAGKTLTETAREFANFYRLRHSLSLNLPDAAAA